MQDSEDNNRSQTCEAIVAWELAGLDTDMAAVTEVRFPEQGSLTKHRTGYTLYWSGKGK